MKFVTLQGHVHLSDERISIKTGLYKYRDYFSIFAYNHKCFTTVSANNLGSTGSSSSRSYIVLGSRPPPCRRNSSIYRAPARLQKGSSANNLSQILPAKAVLNW